MACCGSQRAQYLTSNPSDHAVEAAQGISPSPRVVTAAVVYFEYVGQTGMTVVGPITGRRYRFDATGSIVLVDSRDGPSIAAVPNLRRVKAPAGQVSA